LIDEVVSLAYNERRRPTKEQPLALQVKGATAQLQKVPAWLRQNDEIDAFMRACE
jgi:hypothetical protein